MRSTPTPSRPGLPALLALLLTLLFTLTPRPLRAAADQPAILTLVLNRLDKGEVTVVLRGGDVLVPREDLLRAGILGVEGRTLPAFGKKAVSLRSLAPAISFTVDEDSLALRVEAPARMLRATVIDLARSAPSKLEQRHDASGFLNYALHYTTPLALQGFLETGITLDRVLIQSSLAASSSGELVRGLSSLTFDDPANLRRWVAGETVASGGALGAAFVTAGFAVSKTFALDPYFISSPSLGFTGSSATPAVVDVYVNGVLVKSQAIPPGPFQVQNIQAPAGGGQVRYVIRDAFGRQESVGSPYYRAARSLAKGISEYSYAIGARRLEMGRESFAYGPVGLLAYHRYGVTDWLTAGARLEAESGLVSGGASATLALPVGQLDLELAASAAADGVGFAGLAGYTFTNRAFGGGATVRAVSDGYSTRNLAPADNRQTLAIEAFTGVALGPRVSLATQYALAIDRDAGPSFRVGVSSDAQLTRWLSASAGLGRSFVAQQGTSFDAFVGLTMSFDGGTSASIGASQDAFGGRQAYADVSKSLPPGDGVGGRLYAVASKSPSALATGQYQGPYGRYQATLQTGPAGPSAALDAAGALVVVRGAGILPTRPVQDGFAVLRVPGTPGVRGLLNNHEIGRTDRNGSLVLPGLLPYYGNRIAIDDTDLPLDRQVGAVERIIAPSYRGGVLVDFEVKTARFFRGRVVVDAAGAIVVPSYGEIAIQGPAGEETSPLGAKGEFELSDLPPGPITARILHAGGTCTFKLEVPASDRTVVDLGERRCAQGALKK